MKKLMLVTLSFAISGMIYAHGNGNFNANNEKNSGFWNDMNQIHEIMHNTSIKGENLDNGVSFEITANSDSALESIKKKFLDEREKLDSYFNNLQVSVDGLKNGVKVNLVSNDKDSVRKLQAYGTTSIYRYLHNDVFKGQNGMGYHHGGHGPGMMHGYGNGMGYGPGMMHGYGNGMGYGPGMMYEDEEGSKSQPQSYHWNQKYMGFGSEKM